MLMSHYAESLMRLAKAMGITLWDPDAYVEELKKMGFVRNCGFQKVSNKEIGFIVEGCKLAPIIHVLLGLEGFTGDLCPLASIAMIIIALNKGWEPGKDFFSYVKFAGKLSYFTEDGTRTIFELL
jgi:hypothetical protein